MAQGFVGRKSMVADVYLMNSQKEFVQTLTDTIRHRGAMDLLISDRGEAEISSRVKDILRMYAIDDFQSEPHHKNQNFFERWWQVIKRLTITISHHSNLRDFGSLIFFGDINCELTS